MWFPCCGTAVEGIYIYIQKAPREVSTKRPLHPQYPGSLQAAGIDSTGDNLAGQKRLNFSRGHLQLRNSAPSNS